MNEGLTNHCYLTKSDNPIGAASSTPRTHIFRAHQNRIAIILFWIDLIADQISPVRYGHAISGVNFVWNCHLDIIGEVDTNNLVWKKPICRIKITSDI